MKKTCTLFTLLLILFATSLVLAQENETIAEDASESDKIEAAYECLEEKVDDCTGLTTQEVALTILATPDNIFDDCVDELKDRQSNDNWGNIRDTSLAILAMKHAGEDTEGAEDWLIAQNQTPTDLIWYLQEDSNDETECHIGYDAQDFTINIGTNKKIDENAGTCLTKAQSSFWLQVNDNCYDETFIIECDEDFIANLIYRNRDSSTIYVLEGTESAPAFGSIELGIKSKCFGESSCDYESTAWASIALMETGHDIDEYIPYIVAMSDTNERYLPEAFSYILTNYEDYASALIEAQKLGNYWQADSTAYNRYYDTSLALIALGSSRAEQITNAKNWMLFSQGSNGCWQNQIRETAIALWALEGRAGRSSSGDGGSGVTYCTQANYFCIPSSECTSSQDVGDSYFCPSLSDTCCTAENLKTCSEYGGEQCASSQVCTGNSKKATDTDTCCTGSCQERPQENECESNFYTCMSSCSEFQESISTYACDQGQVCCKTKTTSSEASGVPWWIWVLILLIVVVLTAIAYIYREQLKLYWFQLQTKFKKDKGKGPSPPQGPGPGIPPRPGFPPVRRAPQPRTPMRRRDRRDPAMSETFRKLKEMSR
ncbi:hypothetical protein HNV12_03400 [Methanococcoides sp. SA1]|nr:hypothetical protein [Methanococcoides sp. SA1]